MRPAALPVLVMVAATLVAAPTSAQTAPGDVERPASTVAPTGDPTEVTSSPSSPTASPSPTAVPTPASADDTTPGATDDATPDDAITDDSAPAAPAAASDDPATDDTTADAGTDAAEPDRLALLETTVAARVGAGGLLPTRDGGTCPTGNIVSIWEPIDAADIDRGGYLSPLVVPDPATGTEATGIATCDGDAWAVAGFDADWDADAAAWEVGIQPVDLSGGEDHADEADIEVGPSTKDSGSAAALLESAPQAAGSIPVPSWPSGIRYGDIPGLEHEGQTQCLSQVQPGAQALADLLTSTYPTQQRWSGLRACNVGGKSEHKEGRAVDWYVDAYDSGEKAIGDLLTNWLIQDDPAGNSWGGVRHLGVMYMIWNQRGWYQFAADEGWRTYTGASPHTDHVHFSMTWPGARCETPWWVATDCSGISSGSPTDVVDRVAGSNRIMTSVLLADDVFDQAPKVVIANGDDFPDALAASSLAAAINGPLMLTKQSGISNAVLVRLQRLDTNRVYIVGGTGAVSGRIGPQLRDAGYAVTRLSGKAREHTAARVAREVHRLTGDQRVVIVRKDDFADGLSAANLAGATGAPVLLTATRRLPNATISAMNDIDATGGWVLGGTSAVSESVRQDLLDIVDGGMGRISGPTRYDTAVAVTNLASRHGMDRQPSLLASGEDFPDALGAGPAAVAAGGQLLLVHPRSVSRNGPVLDALSDSAKRIDRAVIAGGSSAVDPAIEPPVLSSIRD